MNDSNVRLSTASRSIYIRRDDGTNVPLCDIRQGDDGFWYASNIHMEGYTPPWILRGMANRLDEANEAWEDKIDAYFASIEK